MKRSGLKAALYLAYLEDRPEAVAEMAREERSVMSHLTAMTYEPDREASDWAVRALGKAAKEIARTDPTFVREHLRRLFWLLNDESGGTGWRAPESIRSILSACPGQFPEFEKIEF